MISDIFRQTNRGLIITRSTEGDYYFAFEDFEPWYWGA